MPSISTKTKTFPKHHKLFLGFLDRSQSTINTDKTHDIKDVNSIIHQNIQSLGNAVDSINDMLETHKYCKILCVTEHWKTLDQLKYLRLKHFELAASFCRPPGKHGGTAIYVKENVKFRERSTLTKLSVINEVECAVIECNINQAVLIVVSVYRPPLGNINIFLDVIEKLLVILSKENKKIVIVGDFNIEMLADNQNKSNFSSMLRSFDLKQTIFTNTRIVFKSASCIDNIFVNFSYIESQVFDSYISDHSAQELFFYSGKTNNRILQSKRIFSEENKMYFINLLKEQDWKEVYEIEKKNIDHQWDVFMNNFILIFNQSFPLKLVKTKDSCSKKNNVDDKIKEHKEKLSKLLMLSRVDENFKDQYKKFKKEYDKLLKTSRSEEYERKLRSSDNKSKCMWSICREIVGKNTKTNDIPIEGDPKDISDKYNQHLVSVVPELLKHLNNSKNAVNIILNNRLMVLEPVTVEKLCLISKKIKNKYSSGIDEIPAIIVKIVVPIISDILCYLINNSFYYGIFPGQLKMALVKPLYKKGDPQSLDSYRPISILPSFSKIFELLMCEQLVNFLKECNILNSHQHGYMPSRSTQTAIFQFTRYILGLLEKGMLGLGICLDLSKAYDCIDVNVLTEKLKLYGLQGNSLNLFRSYLTGRQQRVKVTKNGRDCLSNAAENKFGIAQGSIAGPVLFAIYLNDFNSVTTSPNEHMTCYADDTNLIVGGNSLADLTFFGTDLFNKANQWFSDNKLILNREKTSILLFRTKWSRVEKPEKLTLYNSDIVIAENTKFLGVHLDEFLDWSSHIISLKLKLGKICYGVRVTSSYMNEACLKILYYANFQSVLTYGIIFWGSNSAIEDIFIIQKRILRIIKKMGFRESCRGVFKSCGIMTVYALYIYECVMFFFKNRHMFEHEKLHQYNTRTVSVNYPRHKLSLTEKHPSYACLKFYNLLPNDIKQISCEKLFKNRVRSLLVTTEPYSLSDYVK